MKIEWLMFYAENNSAEIHSRTLQRLTNGWPHWFVSYTIDSIETSLALFDSDIEKVTKLEKTGCISCDKTVRIVNAQGLSEIRGAELLLRFRWHDIKFTTIYLYTDASTQDDTTGLISPITLTHLHTYILQAQWSCGKNIVVTTWFWGSLNEHAATWKQPIPNTKWCLLALGAVRTDYIWQCKLVCKCWKPAECSSNKRRRFGFAWAISKWPLDYRYLVSKWWLYRQCRCTNSIWPLILAFTDAWSKGLVKRLGQKPRKRISLIPIRLTKWYCGLVLD